LQAQQWLWRFRRRLSIVESMEHRTRRTHLVFEPSTSATSASTVRDIFFHDINLNHPARGTAGEFSIGPIE
jgi:hypothetical protein